MARTHKWLNPETKYFVHNGNFNEDRNKIKKNGAGKRNWGYQGDELTDLMRSGEVPPLLNYSARRKSNSFKHDEKFRLMRRGDFPINADEEAIEDY